MLHKWRHRSFVIPAKAGIQALWMPVFTGKTGPFIPV
jgi:hypothetical protein